MPGEQSKPIFEKAAQPASPFRLLHPAFIRRLYSGPRYLPIALWICEVRPCRPVDWFRMKDPVDTGSTMNRIGYRFTAILTALLMVTIPGEAWALRCDSRVIKEGMHEARVIDLCGEPVSVQHLGFVLRPYIVKVPGGSFGAYGTRRVYGGYHEERLVTEMLFNFGPRRLMRVIRFEGGLVSSIKTAGYGYLEKD